jgi:hypothetical protein
MGQDVSTSQYTTPSVTTEGWQVMATWDELQEIGSRWRDGLVIRRVVAVDGDPDPVLLCRAEGVGTVSTWRPNDFTCFTRWVRVSEFEPGDIVTWGVIVAALVGGDYEVRFVDDDGTVLLRSSRGRGLVGRASEFRLVRKADR